MRLTTTRLIYLAFALVAGVFWVAFVVTWFRDDYSPPVVVLIAVVSAALYVWFARKLWQRIPPNS